MRRPWRTPEPLACVLGDTDLVRPLGHHHIRCAVMAEPGAPVRYSRFVAARLGFADPWADGEDVVDQLVRFGRRQERPPVLFYQSDGALLAISRHRSDLADWFRFVMPNPGLVEDLVDKGRFHVLATRLGLPVPHAVLIDPLSGSLPHDLGLRYPVILKPIYRDSKHWQSAAGSAKAVSAGSKEAVRAQLEALAPTGLPVLAQELIPGPESSVESYHLYVDAHGEIVGEFTGRKIRTQPSAYGHSTAVLITAAGDVQRQGRRVVRALGLRGVAKVDFKRTETGELLLLEVNPRFNLWHHPGAIAGVNLPLLVYRDLTGQPRIPASTARAGVSWCKAWGDLPAAREAGVPLRQWAPWAFRSEAKRDIAWDDPGPILGAALFFLRRRASARRAAPDRTVRMAA